jgi:hypothetical protein
LTVIPAASTLVPPDWIAALVPGPARDVPVAPDPAGSALLFAAIMVATAMLTATAPTPTAAGSDPRRMVTRLTVH